MKAITASDLHVRTHQNNMSDFFRKNPRKLIKYVESGLPHPESRIPRDRMIFGRHIIELAEVAGVPLLICGNWKITEIPENVWVKPSVFSDIETIIVVAKKKFPNKRR